MTQTREHMPHQALQAAHRRHAMPKWIAYVSGVIFVFFFIYKAYAAPLPVLSYVQGTYLASVMVAFAGLAVFETARKYVINTIFYVAVSVISMAIVNQIIHIANKVMHLTQESVLHVDMYLIALLLLLLHLAFCRNACLSKKESVILAFMQAVLTGSSLAVFLKLESYPDANPYSADALPVTIYAPGIFLVMAVIWHLSMMTWKRS